MTQADSVLSTPPTNTSALPVDPTRRRLLTIATGGAVAAAIPTTVGMAAAVDPIFAAIDEHRNAHAAHLAAIDELARLEKSHGVHKANWSITEKPCDDANDAFGLLVKTAATTVAGLSAKINYLRAIAEGREAWMLDEREGTALDLIESFAKSLSTIWGCSYEQRHHVPWSQRNGSRSGATSCLSGTHSMREAQPPQSVQEAEVQSGNGVRRTQQN